MSETIKSSPPIPLSVPERGNDAHGIDRREAIRRVTALLGGVVFVGSGDLLTAVEHAHARVTASRKQIGAFDGMRKLNDASFMAATPAQRLTLLEQVDREQKAYMDTRASEAPPHYFRLMKELALLGYFTSEIGCTQAMRYRETPGRFDPCVPHTPGETTWAGHA